MKYEYIISIEVQVGQKSSVRKDSRSTCACKCITEFSYRQPFIARYITMDSFSQIIFFLLSSLSVWIFRCNGDVHFGM